MEKPIIKVHALIALLIFNVIQINLNYIKTKCPVHYYFILEEVMKMLGNENLLSKTKESEFSMERLKNYFCKCTT